MSNDLDDVLQHMRDARAIDQKRKSFLAENGDLMLSRADHDLLLKYWPCWMAETFGRLEKRWSIGGCRIVNQWGSQTMWHMLASCAGT